MIKYCCFYCRKFNTSECSRSCYNALGGEEHLQFCLSNGICIVIEGTCAESFNTEGGKRVPVAEANKDCWEAKEE